MALEITLQEGRDGYAGTDDCLLYAPPSVAEVNYGVLPSATAGRNRWGEWQVFILRFDLSELPRDARVEAARLELCHDSELYPYRALEVEAAPIAAANAGWVEGANDGTRTPVRGTPCWNWLAQGERRWAGSPGLGKAGVDYDPGRGARAAAVPKARQTLTFDLPAETVQAWLADPALNAGLRIAPAGPDLAAGDAVSIATAEYAEDPARRPKLVLRLADRPGLAEECSRLELRRALKALEAEVAAWAARVEALGRPPRAAERLAAVAGRLEACRAALAPDRTPPAAGPAPEALLDGLRGQLEEARRSLSGDRAAAANLTRRLPLDFSLGAASSMEKVFRRDAPFTGPFAETLELEAAGNEYEAAQVVVVPIDMDLREVRWQVEPIAEAPGIRVECCPVGYVRSNTPQPASLPEPSPWWPDPLLTFLDSFDVPRGEVQPLWVGVYVPPGTPAAVYRTRLTVRAANAEPKTIGLQVRVFPFDVPREQHLPTVWGTGEDTFARFYEHYDEKLAWQFFELMLAHRMAPGDLYRTKPTGRPGEDTVHNLASVEALRRLREAGSAWWNIGYVLAPKHVLGGKDSRYTTYDAYLADCVALFRAEVDRVRQAGWPDGTYGIYFHDETSDLEALAQAARVLREAIPGVPLMTTGYDRSYGVGESPAAEVLDIWVPLTPRYAEDLERIRQGRARGKKAWWYICVGPRGRDDLNWFVQYPAIRARLLMGAAAWKYQPDGFLYYRINGWMYNERPITSGPLTDWLPRYHPGLPDGDGQVLCAGPAGPLSTLRLENIRDGLEDYEYWWLLRRLVGEARARGETPAEAALLEVPEDLLRDLRHYSEEPARLLAVRRQLAEAIGALAARTRN